MNSRFVRWLLDLEIIPPDAEGLRLVWEHPWPAWVWVVLVLTVGGLAGWGYTRLLGAKQGRVILAVVRFVLVVLMLVIVSGPMLQLARETIEQDWVLALVDRSASMTIADVEGPGRRLTRDEQLQSTLETQGRMWRELADARQVVWLGFHDGAFNLSEATPSPDPDQAGFIPVQLDEPGGRRTRLNAALEQALQRAAARALSGIVIFTDGRTTDPPTRAAIRRLRSDKVGVYTVPLGSPAPLGDLAIRRVDAPRRAFIRDKVPVVVDVDRLGSAGGAPAVIKLIDEATGEELDRIELPPIGQDRPVTLTAEPALAGEVTWRVVVETDRPDLVPENNVKTLLVELIDRPLRVLFVDGYPRWEYRYLKNLLIREKSIESSVMLLSADRDFAQEGNQPITRLPRVPEELAPFDVVVLGDVPGSFFSPEQLEMVREHVARRGAGLLWIGGERYTPRTFAGTALADLLPVRGSLALPAIGRPVNMVSTLLAERQGLLRLSSDDVAVWPRVLSDPASVWPQLYYAQRIEPGRLKPTAEVLAETAGVFRGTRLPLVIQMRYGAGQIIYVATDEIWRWRYGRGEFLPERFWVPIIRRLGRQSLAGINEAATLEVSPRRLTTTQAMRIELELHDARLAEETRASVGAVVETADGRPLAELELRRVDPTSQFGRDRVGGYAATYLPGVAGQLRVRVDDPELKDLELEAPVEVYAPDDELRRPETDHALLEALAAETGGRMLAPDELGRLPSLLPNRSVRTISPLTERIWDTPLAFGLILLLLAGEWIGRKWLRLA
ncbi:MAG: hypothetical protein ACYS0G_13555 [Planctomycetota bacterium]|jgi:hypothetical protein